MEGLLYEVDQISQKLEQKGVKKNCEKLLNWRIKRSSKNGENERRNLRYYSRKDPRSEGHEFTDHKGPLSAQYN